MKGLGFRALGLMKASRMGGVWGFTVTVRLL